MDEQLAIAQALKYAQELRQLHASERAQRRIVEEALENLETSYATTVRALAAALELRDDESGGHAERVTALALELTRRLEPELAAEPQLEYGFLLHDIGKIGIPDGILRKPGPLDPDELEQMRFHPVLGERVIEQIPYLSGLAREVVASHHERWDGEGYPLGLARYRDSDSVAHLRARRFIRRDDERPPLSPGDARRRRDRRDRPVIRHPVRATPGRRLRRARSRSYAAPPDGFPAPGSLASHR